MQKTNKQKYLTGAEFQAFLNAVNNPFLYTLFFLMGNLGLRIGEVIRLRSSDINFEKKYISVPTLKRDGKSGIIKGSIKRGDLPKTYIDIPITDDIVIVIKKHLERIVRVPDLWLFPYKGSHIYKWLAQRLFKKYAKKAGLDKRFSTHSLRHFKGVSSYKVFKDVKAVQLLLRHRSVNSTYIYTTMDLDGMRELTEKLKTIKKE